RSLTQRRVVGFLRVRDVYERDAVRRLGWLEVPNPAAAGIGIREQVILAARHGEARLEFPAEHTGAPLPGRGWIAAGEVRVRDVPVQPAGRDVTRRRRGGRILRGLSCGT